VTPVSNFTINAPSKPPPSYWIGLSRPPPAPNWRCFAIERARTAAHHLRLIDMPFSVLCQHLLSKIIITLCCHPPLPNQQPLGSCRTILCPILAPLPLRSCGSKIPSIPFVLWILNLLGFIGYTFMELFSLEILYLELFIWSNFNWRFFDSQSTMSSPHFRLVLWAFKWYLRHSGNYWYWASSFSSLINCFSVHQRVGGYRILDYVYLWYVSYIYE
jgi:hypothetical protein